MDGGEKTHRLDPQLAGEQLMDRLAGHVVDAPVAETITAGALRAPLQVAQALQALPRLLTDREGQGTDLRVIKALGRGGTGLVLLARQDSLDRMVAVKSIRADIRDERASHELIREAQLTGKLEHPNIIPIHALGRDGEDYPVMVMKRIEGTSWREALVDPSLLPRGLMEGDGTILEAHLHILLQVCNALRFAHSRGVLHRDLKPDNVMIGEYGEVYLVDWGIAFDLSGEGDHVVRGPEGTINIVGTPSYMAPEMASGQMELLSVRTDVYLLGAVLHELLVGRRRHQGNQARAVLLRAYESAPYQYPEHVPGELATICNRACARQPGDRHPDVESFQEALREYLRHRDSRSTTQVARRSLARLEALVEGVERRGGEEAQEASEGEALEAYQLFGECQFGFGRAVEIWKGNQEALEGWLDAQRCMIRFELEQENLAAADRLMATYRSRGGVPDEALGARRDALAERVEARAAEQNKLRALAREVNLGVGQRARGVLMMMAAAVWASFPLITGALERRDMLAITEAAHVGTGAIMFVIINLITVLVIWRFGKVLLANRVNRQLLAFLILIQIGGLTSRFVGVGLGLGVHPSIAIEMFCYFCFCSALAALLIPMLGFAASCYFVGALLTVWWPQWAWEWLGLAHLVGLNATALLWLRSASAEDAVA